MPDIPNIRPDPQLPNYRYNAAAGRYIDPSGKFVSQQVIRGELDKVLDSVTVDMVNLSKSFRAGTIDGSEFQIRSMDLIKQGHLAGAAMQKGGWAQLSQSDFGRIGAIVKREYQFHQGMLDDILSGKQRLDGTLDVRLRLYGQAARNTYHTFEQEDRAIQGYDEERRDLHGGDSCTNSSRPGCIEEAARGWVPIGESLDIGAATCLANCRCSKSYRNSVTGETV